MSELLTEQLVGFAVVMVATVLWWVCPTWTFQVGESILVNNCMSFFSSIMWMCFGFRPAEILICCCHFTCFASPLWFIINIANYLNVVEFLLAIVLFLYMLLLFRGSDNSTWLYLGERCTYTHTHTHREMHMYVSWKDRKILYIKRNKKISGNHSRGGIASIRQTKNCNVLLQLILHLMCVYNFMLWFSIVHVANKIIWNFLFVTVVYVCAATVVVLRGPRRWFPHHLNKHCQKSW